MNHRAVNWVKSVSHQRNSRYKVGTKPVSMRNSKEACVVGEKWATGKVESDEDREIMEWETNDVGPYRS